MQAVILAGGFGRRLRPLTKNLPKSMIPILGKPYLHYQLEFLREQGINDILILIGYLGHKIVQYFKNGSHLGLRIKYSKEKDPLGTGGALKNSSAFLEQSFLLIYGDSYLPINYNAIEAKLIDYKKKGLIVICDNRNQNTDVPSNIGIDDSFCVTDYSKDKKHADLKYVDAGVSAFKKEILRYIPSDKRVVSLEEEIFPMLIQEKELMAYITTQRFYDIGTKNRIKQFERFLRNDYFQNTI